MILFYFKLIAKFLGIALFELYFIQSLKTISINYSSNKRKTILWIAYFLAFCSILLFGLNKFYPELKSIALFRFIGSIIGILVLSKILGCLVLLLDDLIRAVKRIIFKFKSKDHNTSENKDVKISRSKFLNQVAVISAIIPALSLIYGMVRGAYRYKIHTAKITSPNLPDAFIGFKIVQLSDFHSGSFFSTKPLVNAFSIAMDQKPDIIFFTGDLVNNVTSETDIHLESYKMLKAPYGVYSCLGNHDYGDYSTIWPNPEAKEKNFQDLKAVHANSGWRLLLNEHVAIEKDGQKIAVLGVENWGAKLKHHKYGKLENAHAGTEAYPFKILLSHDPSHWDMQVSQIEKYKDIDLTLSGHTHGTQLGIEIPGFKWSPIQYLYKHWAGLYKQDNQYLYVNRGLGFIGYPGRLGIWPEITVIELAKV